MTDGAPSRALREIHRSPVTATMFMATTSQSVRDVMRPRDLFGSCRQTCAIRALIFGSLDFAIDVGLHLAAARLPSRGS